MQHQSVLKGKSNHKVSIPLETALMKTAMLMYLMIRSRDPEEPKKLKFFQTEIAKLITLSILA